MKYINILFGIKLWLFVGLVGLFLLLTLLVLCLNFIKAIKNKRKIKLLKRYNCIRYLSGVPSVGNGAFYSWKTADYAINIDERDVVRLSYKQLKDLLKKFISK